MPEPVEPARDNETRRIVAEAVAAGARDISLANTPAFAALATILVEGVAGDVLLSFDPGPASVQGNGVVGGGTLANMLDTAMAVAVLSGLAPGQNCTTVSLTVNMMRPVAPGRVTVRAVVDRLGKRIAFAQARLLDGGGRVVATASSSLAVFQG
ncbi:MAG: PaaI family thioesterase [Sphingomonas fennica]